MQKKKLFVGGLNWDTSDKGLREAFEEFGSVTEAAVITDRYTGRSRGFGFVTFADASDAEAALDEMDGASLDGRTVNVDYARPRRSSGNNSSGGGGGSRW